MSQLKSSTDNDDYKTLIKSTKWLALRTHKHHCTAIGPALFPLCMCSECVHLYLAAYNVRMQTVNKSLINQVLRTGILSDTLKFDKVMIHTTI